MRRSEITFAASLAILTAVVAFVLPEKAAIVLIGLTFMLPLFIREIATNWRLLSVVWVVLAARHLASIINVFYITLMGADVDAVGYQETASLMTTSTQPTWFAEFGNIEVGSLLYARFLSFFYSIFGTSKLLGQELSVLAFMLSCYVLLKLIKYLKADKYRVPLVAMYGLLPSGIVFTSVTLREAYQMLAFLSLIFFAVRLRAKRDLLSAALLCLSGATLAMLHNGLLVFAVFVLCIAVAWAFRITPANWRRQNPFTLLAVVAMIVAIGFTWFTFASGAGGVSKALLSGDAANYAGSYRNYTTTSYDRASYGGKLDTTSLTGFLTTAPQIFVSYMMAPFPWQISSPVDIYAALEGVMRVLFLFQAARIIYRSSGERRSSWMFITLSFLMMEFLWAMGTANWGTAIRHHIVAYGLLVIVGGPGVVNIAVRPFKWFPRILRKPSNPGRRHALDAGFSGYRVSKPGAPR